MEVLSPTEALDHHADPAMPLEDDHDDYPVPQVRALPPIALGGAGEKPNPTKAPHKANTGKEKDDDDGSILPRVPSTSTVLAPIGAKTNYAGPALLRSRQLGMKRSMPSSGHSKEGGGEETSKKPRSEPSAGCGAYRW